MRDTQDARERLERIQQSATEDRVKHSLVLPDPDISVLLDALDSAEKIMHAQAVNLLDADSKISALTRERDEALAVIERAKGLFHGDGFKDSTLGRLLHSVPADVLRERDSEKWKEGLKAGLREANDKERGAVNNPALDPYRETREH